MQGAQGSSIPYNTARVIAMDMNPDSGLIPNDDDRLTLAFQLLSYFIGIKFMAFEQEVSTISVRLFCFSHKWSYLSTRRQLSSNHLRAPVSHFLNISF